MQCACSEQVQQLLRNDFVTELEVEYQELESKGIVHPQYVQEYVNLRTNIGHFIIGALKGHYDDETITTQRERLQRNWNNLKQQILDYQAQQAEQQQPANATQRNKYRIAQELLETPKFTKWAIAMPEYTEADNSEELPVEDQNPDEEGSF